MKVMAYIVKHWAKQRQVNEPYKGTLSSYAWVLLVINFLQQRSPPILPCLQRYRPTAEVRERSAEKENTEAKEGKEKQGKEEGEETKGKEEEDQGKEKAERKEGPQGWRNRERTELRVQGYNCYFYPHVDLLRDYGKANTETLGGLLLAFFEHYAHRFDYRNSVASVRVGVHLTKRQKRWVQGQSYDRASHLFCIEDPFEVTHDLGRVVNDSTFGTLRWELKRAYQSLTQRCDLQHLCVPYQSERARERHLKDDRKEEGA